MKKENKINIGISIIILLLGIIIQLLARIITLETNKILNIALGIYGLIKLIEYILTKPKKDYEIISTSIISFLISLSGIFLMNNNKPIILGITLAIWISLMSIIKLIKLDNLDDKKNKMFYINLYTFIIFILVGLSTCINLYFNQTVQYLILGYLFIIIGLLDLTEDIINYLTTTK